MNPKGPMLTPSWVEGECWIGDKTYPTLNPPRPKERKAPPAPKVEPDVKYGPFLIRCMYASRGFGIRKRGYMLIHEDSGARWCDRLYRTVPDARELGAAVAQLFNWPASSVPKILASDDSDSALIRLTPQSRLDWDNDITFHVAQNAVALRQYRGMTQTQVANLMPTSQSAVARIEAEGENITLGTLKRLIYALRGRLQFAITPEEINMPSLPEWWTREAIGLGSSSEWALGLIKHADGDSLRYVGAIWSAATNSRDPGVLTSGEAT